MATKRDAAASLSAGVSMDFRAYRMEDFEAIYVLDVACFDLPYRFSRRMMRWSLEAKKALVVVAEEEGIAGFVAVHVERGGIGYVVTLDVAEAWRRKGLAGELMARAEEQTRAAGRQAMSLHVSVLNEGAVRFYEGRSYERVERDVGFYGEGGDAWVYRKAL